MSSIYSPPVLLIIPVETFQNFPSFWHRRYGIEPTTVGFGDQLASLGTFAYIGAGEGNRTLIISLEG